MVKYNAVILPIPVTEVAKLIVVFNFLSEIISA